MAVGLLGREKRRRSVSPDRDHLPNMSLKGVIDIGSNSVRLMVYALRGKGLTPHYNEKIMAGLGRELMLSGRLNPDGVEMAMQALRRFRNITDGLGDVPVDAFATAAVRTADDGPDFVARVLSETGFRISVLTGVQEAQSSARGVLAGLRDVRGVIGDLGGSSLELISAADGVLGEGETHLLGPLALQRNGELDRDFVTSKIASSLKTSRALGKGFRTFYAVGGSFRAFARVHMALSDYPLHLLHGYTMDAKQVRRLAKKFLENDPDVLDASRSISSKRAALLPYAAQVLDGVFATGDFADLRVSAYGLREGRVFLSDEDVSARQVLLDGLETVGRLLPPQRAFVLALRDFISPVFDDRSPVLDDAETDSLMLDGACRLADIGATLHPEYRADLAYRLVRDGPYGGCNHRERVFLAQAAARRYSKSFKTLGSDGDLLSENALQRANQIGAVMRLGAVLSGRTPKALQDASLSLKGGELRLDPGPLGQDMISEFVLRRLQQAATQLQAEAVVVD